MIITRKIEIYVSENDKNLKQDYIHTLYQWRDGVRRAANMIVAHKFVQGEVAQFTYIDEELLDRFANAKGQVFASAILRKEKGNSEQNTTYRVAASMLKGEVPADIYSCLNQSVAKTFKETYVDVLKGKASVRSYKNNIPVPFSAKSIANIHRNEEDGRYYFNLFGVPFCCRFGKDRSNNEDIVRRSISGEYKICSSSIQIDDGRNKTFLLFCVDIPKQEVKLIEGKKLYAFLGVVNPIQCTCDVNAKNGFDSGLKWFNIGTAKEFLHRRRQIQEAMHLLQVSTRYNTGGKGRTKKCGCLDHYHEKEINYVNTRLHTYSRMLVDLAVKHHCSEIVLMKQEERAKKALSDNANGDNYVLRNWGYYNLSQKIDYKCKKYGIKLTIA